MAGPFQANVVYDASTVTNFKAWSQNFIAANLSSMGWTKTADNGQVNWSNVTTTAQLPSIILRPNLTAANYRGAWVGPTTSATSYKGTTSDASANGNDVVTYTDGLTYICTSGTSITGVAKIVQQTSLTLNLTAASMSGTAMTLTGAAGGAATNGLGLVAGTVIQSIAVTNSSGAAGTGYITITINGTGLGGVTNGFVGYPFTTLATTNGFNNVVGSPCTASSEVSTTTLITIQWGTGVLQAGSAGTIGTDFQGWTFHVTGFSNSGNNGFFGCTSSTSTTLVFSQTSPGGANYAGVTETHAATAVSSNTYMTLVQAAGIVNGGSGISAPSVTASASLNNFAGLLFGTSGFSVSANNTSSGFTCVFSSGNALTLTNASGAHNGAWIGGTTVSGTVFMMSPPNTTGALFNTSLASWGFWMPFHYEVWQTNDGLTPIYLRIQYGANNNTGTNWNPIISMQIGYATNGNGSVINGQFNGNVLTPETIIFGNITGVTNLTEVYECSMAGSGTAASGAWLTILMWRTNSSVAQVFALERGLNASGAAVDSYFTVWTYGKTQAAEQNSVLKPPNTSGPLLANWATVVNQLGTAAYMGATCAYPVFPIVGYLGNPATAVVVMPSSDCVEGQLLNVSLYGTIHTYLVTKNTGTVIASGYSVAAPCIRFEAA